MRKCSALILILMLTACAVSSPTATATPGLQPSISPQPELVTLIPTSTLILPTDTPTATEAAPTPLPRLAGGSPLTLASIHMIDSEIGWGLEKGGHIIHTRDGGVTWQDVTPPQGLYDENGFFARDANTAWATARPSDSCDASQMTWSDYQACMPGPHVLIWRTVDGGKTWRAGKPYEAEDGHYKPIAIQFRDASAGWFFYVSSFGPMGSTTMGMAKTEDGGISWTPIAAPGSICVQRTMIFINMLDGWSGSDCRYTPTVGTPLQEFISGKSSPELYRTTNGSQSWDNITIPSPEVFPAEFTSSDADPNISILCGTTSMRWISFQSFSIRWTCSAEMGTPYLEDFSYLYLTSDNGQSWHSWLATGNEFFLNAQTGWRLYSPGKGQVSQLQQTTDSGQAWKTIKTVTWQTAQFDFVSEQVGWAIVTGADAASFLHTTDGGRNWSELKPKTVIVISPENVSQLAKLETWPANMIDVLTLSSDWTRMVSRAEDYSGLRLWSRNNRQPYHFIPFQRGDCGLRSRDKVMLSPDGTLLVAGLCNATFHIWRVADGTLLYELNGELPDDTSFSPDGSMLATTTYESVTVWKMPELTWLQTFRGDFIEGISFSPDGTILAFASGDGLQLWRIADGTLLQTLTSQNLAFGAVAFSPDGMLLASVAERSGLQLWRVADGTLLKTLEPAYGRIGYKVVFSPDGKLLVSARYEDGGSTVHLWQIPEGELLRTMTSANRPISFSPDGSYLAIGSATVLQVWGIPAQP